MVWYIFLFKSVEHVFLYCCSIRHAFYLFFQAGSWQIPREEQAMLRTDECGQLKEILLLRFDVFSFGCIDKFLFQTCCTQQAAFVFFIFLFFTLCTAVFQSFVEMSSDLFWIGLWRFSTVHVLLWTRQTAGWTPSWSCNHLCHNPSSAYKLLSLASVCYTSQREGD